MATLPSYASAEAVAEAFDVATTATQTARLLRLTQTASRTVDRALNRRFYPRTGTSAWRVRPRSGPTVWFPEEVLALTSADFDGSTVTGYVLEPRHAGPPYDHFDLTDATTGAGEVITLTGRFGYCEDTATAGTLASSPDADDTTITVSDASLIGLGDLLLIDSERMVVTARALTDTTANTSGALTASSAETTVPVNTGSLVKVGETITIDSERMRVIDISGNNLSVRRAVDGSVLATHANPSDVYASRLLTVERAAVGTTGASHTSSTVIYRHVPPPLITELTIAEAQVLYGQESAGWSTSGNENATTRRSADTVRKDAVALYRRHNYGAV